MNIHDLSISDCPITKVIINKNEIVYYFSEAYSKSLRQYISNIAIKIKDWSKFSGKHFISKSPFEKPLIKNILENEIEPFELIQEFFIENNNLVFKGYSSKSEAWLEYTFQKPNIEVKSNP
ncbi:hypothetical protein [Neisseria sp. 83E34]|uniref:hypothetical protein n=1 Tax=Neisseria sp. 83E34 TaxID=1692264 RepID=UPI0006CE9687|nr:hypothetical protein [Neisseria sp. 83E34]KPN71801.1 hypothetical protein AKG09_05890 [Neisseria sp. 83E34]